MTTPMLEADWDDAPLAPLIRLRDYQLAWKDAVQRDRAQFCRLLLVACTGSGKTSFFASVAADEWAAGKRTLILENRDKLVRQTAKRIRNETGLDVDIEMAGEHASPFAPIVVASVQTLCRENRLTGFSDQHFQLLVADESHHALAKSWQKVLNYFHYGSGSLTPEWTAPADSTYEPKCHVIGVTATPEINGERNLGEFYQCQSAQYDYLQAVRDGWLVPPVTKSMPLKVDLRGLRPGRTPNGSDFKAEELSQRMVPILESLAQQVAAEAGDRKTIAFLPSIECARLFTAAIQRTGLKGIFVSGECLDVDEKTEDFVASGPGTVLSNACLYVEGADFPDISCVVCARATKSVGFYKQIIGRGTRVLPGVVDGLDTPEERRAAIAASAKKDLLVLDPLWISDRIDLCDVYNLFTDKPETKERMKALGPPSEESAREAERDFIKALEKEARKHARKQARIIDPLIWATSIGEETLAHYVPETTADARSPSPGQISFLQKNHIDHSKIRFAGLASRVISKYLYRLKSGLASAQQLNFLKQLGVTEDQCATLTKREASDTIDRILKEKRG